MLVILMRIKAVAKVLLSSFKPPMSFPCPHFRINDDFCLRLKTDCVPGRRGCVADRRTGCGVLKPAGFRTGLFMSICDRCQDSHVVKQTA
jgi:hypothetical protein